MTYDPYSRHDPAFQAFLSGEKADRQAAGLRFAYWTDLRSEAPPDPPWVWEGYMARGTVTMLAGKPKAGKSTLACDLMASIDAGAETFLGRRLEGGPVVYLSEEGAATLAPKLTSSSRSVVLTRDAAWPKPSWPDLIAASVEQALSFGAVALVIDALAFWAAFGEGQEKDSGAAQATMDALGAATAANLAVALVHHQRKSGGEDGDAVRGSGAIFGAVDVLVELERLGEDAPPTHRRLVAVGRWPTTPPVLVAERHGGGEWRLVGEVGSRSESAALGIRGRLLAALPEEPLGATEAELVELVGVDKRKVSGPLRELVEEGLVSRTGAGQRGNPYRYEKVPQKVPQAGAPSPAEKVPAPLRGAPSAKSPVPVPRAARAPSANGHHRPADPSTIDAGSLEETILDARGAEAIRASVGGDWL